MTARAAAFRQLSVPGFPVTCIVFRYRGSRSPPGTSSRMWAAAASRPPAPWPMSAPGRPLLVSQMRRLGVDSVPIALFIAVFTGIVLSLLSSYIFTGAVPLYFVGALVGKTIMMELGPVLTGMALAGRVGASIAAELGTMKVTEQVDALETLAYDRYAYLVVPRVLAAT